MVYCMMISGINSISTINFQSSPKKNSDKSQKNCGFNNVLMGTLIGLASLSPITPSSAGSNVNNQIVQPKITTVLEDEPEALTVKFNDENGILEPSDFVYSSNKAQKLAKGYLDGLNLYMGKKCTQSVSDLANNLAHVFNVSNNYVYDFNTDELIKDGKSTITYDKFGRVLSTGIKYSTGDEEIVTYKYFKNGNIDKANYINDKIIEYRKDGTRFSLETTDPFVSKKTVLYNNKGVMSYKSIIDSNSQTELSFDENGKVIKHFYKDNNSGWQKIYNGGSLALMTFYDGKGRVKKYIDNYFEKQGEDVAINGYLSTRTIHREENYNILYKEAPIDGKIINPIRQGTTGTCYIAGIVNSLVRIPLGRMLLDETLPNDFDKNKCIVDFKGLNKRYTLSADAISHNMSRLGRKDADYSGLVMAYEKFRESGSLFDGSINLPDCFYIEHRGENDRRVDSGSPSEFFYALTGQVMFESNNKITDMDIQKARKCLATGRGIVNAGTIQKENKNDEIPLIDRGFGVVPKHNVSVTKIDDKTITIYDSVTEKETAYPIHKFKKYFSKLYWATLEG